MANATVRDTVECISANEIAESNYIISNYKPSIVSS